MNAMITPELPAAARPGDGEAFYEIIDGRRVEVPPMSNFASLMANDLAFALQTFVRQHDLGKAVTEILFHLALPVDRNRRPDVAFVSYVRWPKSRPYEKQGNAWDVVPDLACEIVSPTDSAEELLEKLDEYFRAGVRLAWVVFPVQQVVYIYESLTQVRGLARTDTLDGGTVLPGFALPLTELFTAT